MRGYGITINDIPFTEQCTALTFTDYANAVGRFDAAIRGTHGIEGFQKVKIFDDGIQVFQGRVGSPVKENVPGGSGMPIGGLEWTGNLKDYITNYNSEVTRTLTEFLTDALINSIYGIGDIDELSETEVEVQAWDTQLQFLEFTFTDTCIVHDVTAEAESELSTDNMTFCLPSMRASFLYDGATTRFYVIGYDVGNTKLQYNWTVNGISWNGWNDFAGATPAASEGDDGQYTVLWDSANAKLYMIVQDNGSPDLDCWTGAIADATGVITATKRKDNIRGARYDLMTGLELSEDNNYLFFCGFDNAGSPYDIAQSVDEGVTWTRPQEFSSVHIPKYLFKKPSSDSDFGADDMIIVMFDDTDDDLQEYHFDYSAGTAASDMVIADILSNGSCLYASGYQDSAEGMFLVWEDDLAGGSANINFSSRLGGIASWDALVTIVNETEYQTPSNMMLGGDEAQNLYLFYYYDDNTDVGLHILRRLEGVWETSTELDTNCDVDGINCPDRGLAGFVVYKDTDDDAQFTLLDPEGIVATMTYSNAEEDHDYESGKDFDSEVVSASSSLEASLDWASSGVQSIKAYTPAFAGGQKNAYGVYGSPSHSEIWERKKIKVTQADDWGTLSSANDNFHCIVGYASGNAVVYAGWGINGAGVIEWRLLCRNGAAWITTQAGTPVIGTEYCIEVHWVKGAAGVGYAELYVDSALMCASGFQDTDNYGNITSLFFGLSCNNRDGATTLYMDEVAWGYDGDNRVGCSAGGWFRTDSYTASTSMINWGSLDSTNDDDANTSWGVWDDTPTLIVDGLITSVDLEDAGVANTETVLQIRADIISESTYVHNILLNEKQGLVDYLLDFEAVSTAIKKTADIIGYEYKLSWENLVNMKAQLGEDKSDYIILKTARSTSSYPDVAPNIIKINREPDFDSFANAVKILGAGDYPTRVEGSAADSDSQDEFGVHWISVTNKDCTSAGMCNTYARTEVNIRKDPMERIDISFYDDYDSKDIEIGDIVWVVDEETELDQKARIVSLTYGWNVNGRFANASLINRTKAKTFIEYLAEVTDLKRWV